VNTHPVIIPTLSNESVNLLRALLLDAAERITMNVDECG